VKDARPFEKRGSADQEEEKQGNVKTRNIPRDTYPECLAMEDSRGRGGCTELNERNSGKKEVKGEI